MCLSSIILLNKLSRNALYVFIIQFYSKYYVKIIFSGENLFKLIKKACGPNFEIYSKNNNNNLRFKELWTVLSECRHAITHSQAVINLNKINKTEYHKKIFDYLFLSTVLRDNNITIELDYSSLDHLLKIVSEFAFQIYKLLSQSENLDWEIKK